VASRYTHALQKAVQIAQQVEAILEGAGPLTAKDRRRRAQAAEHRAPFAPAGKLALPSPRRLESSSA
jgi:hypothetical protein